MIHSVFGVKTVRLGVGTSGILILCLIIGGDSGLSSTLSVLLGGTLGWYSGKALVLTSLLSSTRKSYSEKYGSVEVTSGWSYVGSVTFISNGESNPFIPFAFDFCLVYNMLNYWSSVICQPNRSNQNIESSSVSLCKLGIQLNYFLRSLLRS